MTEGRLHKYYALISFHTATADDRSSEYTKGMPIVLEKASP